MGAFAIAGIFPWLYLTNADDYSGDSGGMASKISVAALAGVLVGLLSLPGVKFVTWVALTPGCQMRYMDHTGCHQLNHALTAK
jgi:hypothetical protein